MAAVSLTVFAEDENASKNKSGSFQEASMIEEVPKANSVWSDSLAKYRNDDQVEHLIFVQWIRGTSNAKIQVYEKDKSWNNAWSIVLECPGYVGRNGIKADKKEGDSATPSGDFGVLTAFGIKKNPGTKLDWLDVTEDLWCPDAEGPDYNKIVSTKNGGTAEGEHLIEYSPQYNYAMFLDYNKECKPKEGSAIFFHCIGPKEYTGGCVAVSEENMKEILKIFGKYDRVIIAPYSE